METNLRTNKHDSTCRSLKSAAKHGFARPRLFIKNYFAGHLRRLHANRRNRGQKRHQFHDGGQPIGPDLRVAELRSAPRGLFFETTGEFFGVWSGSSRSSPGSGNVQE